MILPGDEVVLTFKTRVGLPGKTVQADVADFNSEWIEVHCEIKQADGRFLPGIGRLAMKDIYFICTVWQ